MEHFSGGDTRGGPFASTDSQSGPPVIEDVVKPLRLPHDTSEALRVSKSNMGLGRGINLNRIEETAAGSISSKEDCRLGFGLGHGASVNNELAIPIGIGRGRPLLNLK
jgi:hypothetical protein